MKYTKVEIVCALRHVASGIESGELFGSDAEWSAAECLSVKLAIGDDEPAVAILIAEEGFAGIVSSEAAP